MMIDCTAISLGTNFDDIAFCLAASSSKLKNLEADYDVAWVAINSDNGTRLHIRSTITLKPLLPPITDALGQGNHSFASLIFMMAREVQQ